MLPSLRDSEASHDRSEDTEEHSAGEIFEEVVLRQVTAPKFDPAGVTKKQNCPPSCAVFKFIYLFLQEGSV